MQMQCQLAKSAEKNRFSLFRPEKTGINKHSIELVSLPRCSTGLPLVTRCIVTLMTNRNLELPPRHGYLTYIDPLHSPDISWHGVGQPHWPVHGNLFVLDGTMVHSLGLAVC
jgi:hypothetical protein